MFKENTDMDESELLFELSSSDRIKIMLLICKQNLRLSYISKKMNMTVTETSRHLQRLSEAKLLEKTVDGSYKLTPFGQLALSLMPSFKFISAHQEYLVTHNLSNLPSEFTARIGDLQNCTFRNDVMMAFHSVEKLIEEAQEYVWILSNQVLMSTIKPLENALKRSVKFKLILPEEFTWPSDLKPPPIFTSLTERRSLKEVDVILVLSEKQARLAFPTVSGTMDYIGFGATDEQAHKWCSDLFMYYWQKAGKPPIQR
jgi:predicted transcriptional regulator